MLLPGAPPWKRPGQPATRADRETGAGTRFTVLLPISSYALLMACVALWLHSFPFDFHQIGLRGTDWLSNLLRGGFVGMALCGLLMWSWRLLPASQRFRGPVPGLGAPGTVKIGVWMSGGFAEELWRVTCLAGLVNAGYSYETSLLVCAVAFALPSFVQGMKRSLLDGVEGIILGALFLWQQSFWAPLAADLMLQAVLWGVGRYWEDLHSDKTSRRVQFNCPVCGTGISFLQVKMRGTFRCPSCQGRLSVSDDYQARMRWLGLAVSTFFLGCGIGVFAGVTSGNVDFWMGLICALGAARSALTMIQVNFPPTLQYGDEDFIGLNLGDRRAPESSPPGRSEQRTDDHAK